MVALWAGKLSVLFMAFDVNIEIVLAVELSDADGAFKLHLARVRHAMGLETRGCGEGTLA